MKLGFDKLIIRTFGGKTGRLNYFLSVLIVWIGFYYLDTFYFSDSCLVCNPIMSFPWQDLLSCFAAIALMGVSFFLVFFQDSFEFGFSIWTIMYIILVLFFIIMSIRRCHDIGYSGWRSLLPIYCPLILLFQRAEIDEEQESEKTSLLKNSVWFLLILLIMVVCIFLENLKHIHMHNAL